MVTDLVLSWRCSARMDSPSRFPRDKAFQDSPGTLQIVIGLSSNCRLTAHRRLVVTNAPRRRLKNEQSLAVGAAFSRGDQTSSRRQGFANSRRCPLLCHG